MRLLIAEDERHLRELLLKRLSAAHYSVDACENGLEAFDFAQAGAYDALVLDIMMPGMDGLAIVRGLREMGVTTPVLFLTAKDTVGDRVMGLDAGANDYLVKPFAFDELLARIRVLTRAAPGQNTHVYTLADLTLDSAAHKAYRGGQELFLSSREFSILEYMIRNQGMVLSREKIEENVWNLEYTGASNMVDVYIRYLRKKVDEGFTPKLIHTVRYVGYVLREEA